MHAYLMSLRTYSRIGRLENDPEPVNLHDLVDEALCRLRAEIEATGARIAVGALPTVTVERGQMTLVFESLLSNAVKFAGSEPPAVTVTCVPRPHAVELAVTDNGIGIEPGDKLRAFGMLERLNGHQYPGIGMGLAIARKAIERHGGAIWYEPGVSLGAPSSLPCTNSNAITTGITAFGATGFTIGNNVSVNANGENFYYLAFNDNP